MDAQARGLGWLRNAVVGMLALALLAGVLLPVYSDEVGWRFQERAGFDGVDKLYSDICGPNTLARPPFFMWPVRFYSALFNSAFADPLYVRLSGILYALAWLALLMALLRRISADKADRSLLTIFGVGLMCLGTMPLLLIWSRPEQPLLLAVTGALLVAWSDWRTPDRTSTAGEAWGRSAFVVVLAVIALSYHLKGVFLVPLFLACLWLASRGRAAHLPRGVASVLIVAACAAAAFYWINRLQCPADPTLREEFARNNTGALLVGVRDWQQLVVVIGKLIDNLNPLVYAGLAAPQPKPLSSWLPEHQIGKVVAFRWFLALIAVWALAAFCAVWALFTAIARAWRERRFDPRLLMGGMLLMTVLGWTVTQHVRNVYEATFVLPLAMLGIVMALSARGREQRRLSPWINVTAALVGIGALLSPPSIAAIYGPSLLRAAGQRGYVAEQRYSVAPFGYADMRADILAAARKCGIVDAGKANALMIDDATYFALMQSKLPQHWIGILPRPKSIPDPVAYLKSRNSDGIVVGCHLLPRGLRDRAKAEGKFCCLGPPGW